MPNHLQRIMLIGAGTMGSLHARVIAQSGVASLATVVEPREEAGRALADRFGATWSPEPEFTDIDGVIIAAATEAHPSLVEQALNARVPFLVEKPVASSWAMTKKIVDDSRVLGVPMMCGLLERYNPAIITAQALVREPIYVTSVRHSPYASRIRTGVAWDLLIHDVDIATRLLGEPASVQGALAQFSSESLPGAEDIASAVLTFSSGALAELSASRLGQNKIRTVSIYEVDRQIEIDLLRHDVTIYHHVSVQAGDADGRGFRQQTVIEIPELVSSREPLAAQLDRFASLIRGEIDADIERDSLLPSHQAVDQLIATAHQSAASDDS